MEHSNAAVLNLQQYLTLQLSKKITRIVPAYQSLLVGLGSTEMMTFLYDAVHAFFTGNPGIEKHKALNILEIPVCYNTALGTDLEYLCDFAKAGHDEVINLHLSSNYRVYFIGFLPGFAYMGKVDDRIAIPRKKAPVPTKAGAVGIAGIQTGIYPSRSPGGWHIIGYTPLQMFDIGRAEPCLLNPGDTVKFVPIDMDTYFSFNGNS
jgi:inhibitor of KinA